MYVLCVDMVENRVEGRRETDGRTEKETESEGRER